jgi:DNA mismatch repair protein MutS2
LAVKANFRGRIRGIVHEVSSSGQTIFIEPEEVVEKNNELLIENRRLEAEIRRVLRELTVCIAIQRDELKNLHRDILFLETIRARARYSFERKGIFAQDDREEKLILLKARHPLLGRRAVPLDLCMENGIRTVIITGPNTGGKTVALKTLGLLAMMNQFGLALPVDDGTILPVFDGVYADIGDEQSLSQSLSTFSAHMTNISDIIRQATDRSLVLLDELGSGTDPEEGSAIAMAILDHFIEQKTRLIVTTHHGILKNYGYTREGVENASMEFDSRTLSPTYKIVMGIPGESRAIDIASRTGFPSELLKRARGYLDEERSDVSALIAGLKEKHRELDAASEAGKLEGQRLLEERRHADLKELRLKQQELQLRSDGAGSLRKLLGESRKTLENLVREVKEGELSREKTLKVKDFLSGLEAQVRAGDEGLEREGRALAAKRRMLEEEVISGDKRGKGKAGTGKPKAHRLEPGMEVLTAEGQRQGRILRLDKKGPEETFWVVEIGSLKMSFSEKDIIPMGERDSRRKSASWTADLAPSTQIHPELRLRGMRLTDALEALERQIDAAVLGGLYVFSVVHGKGDGILSKGVHDFLKKDPRVADYYFSRPELGGFGRTEVILK